MKKYILIFAKTEYFKTPYDQWLTGTELIPIIFVYSKFAEGYQHLKNVYSFNNYEQNNLIKDEALKIGKQFNLVGIFARAESDIIRVSELRKALNLPGQTIESALAYRNKVIMKNHLKNSNIILPKYCQIESVDTVRNFVKVNGYPVVIKPLSESGSSGVVIINNENMMNDYLNKTPLKEMEIEEFIEGKMFHVDGLVLDGEIVFIQPYKYINSCLAYRENNHIGGCTVSPSEKIYKDLVDTAKNIINTLPSPKNMAFHTEIWQKNNGELVFCEIASRTGGATVSLSIEYSFNFNIDKIWFLAECNLISTFNEAMAYKPSGWLAIPPLNGLLTHMPSNNEPNCVKISHYCGKAGERYYGGIKSGLFLAGYAIGGDTEKIIVQNISHTADWFSKESKWDLNPLIN